MTPNAADGFAAIIGAGLEALTRHRPGVLARQAESVHQMRVALRRLRAALVLFAPHLEPGIAAGHHAALRGLGRTLGEARDWHVFGHETLPAAFAEPLHQDWRAAMAHEAALQERAAHDRLDISLQGPGFDRLVPAIAAWSQAPSVLGANAASLGLASMAPALLDRVARKVHRRGCRVARLDGQDLHDLRKALKKLRYSVDFFGGFYAEKPVRAYLQRCKALQERLGRINDAAAAHVLGARLMSPAAPLAQLTAWADSRRKAGRRGLGKAFAGLAEADPFWR